MAWALAGALALGGAGCAAPRSGQTASPAQSAVSEPWDPLERLEEAGLSPEEAELVWQQLPDGYRAALEGREPPVWLAYLVFDFAWPERLDRYQRYHRANPQLTAEEAVVRVNIGLDQPPYEDPREVEEPQALTALVNKYHALPADYDPEVELLGSYYSIVQEGLRPQAREAFLEMAQAAAQEGLRLYGVSAYRSYEHQTWSYQRYVNRDGAEAADTYSARPGHSEHQTGLALDVNTASLSDHFEETAEYAWLQENAGRFGFILRFPQGKEELTGYQFEPWHYRYVGEETARVCWEKGWTLEEYAARQPAPGRG